MKKTVAVVMASIMLLMMIFLDYVFTMAYHRWNGGRTKASCSGAPADYCYGDDPDSRYDLDHDHEDGFDFD